MADPYFLDRSPSTGHNLTRISNNFHLENLAAVSSYSSHGGLLQTPPRFLSTPSFHTHQFYPFVQQKKSPSLLPPLPTPSNLRPPRSLPSQPRSQSLKKSKSTKKEKDSAAAAVVDRRFPSRTISSAAAKKVVRVEELEKLSDCFFTIISPPPSSLPLPKFSMRPAKALNCNVEAVGADDGASAADDLRRLLRLH